jgi:hypothetical protein
MPCRQASGSCPVHPHISEYMSNSEPPPPASPSTDADRSAGKQATVNSPRSLFGIVRKIILAGYWFRSSGDPSLYGQLPGQEGVTEPPSVTAGTETRENDRKESADSTVSRMNRLESPSDVNEATIGYKIGSERRVNHLR